MTYRCRYCDVPCEGEFAIRRHERDCVRQCRRRWRTVREHRAARTPEREGA